jgi:putative transposase
VARLCDHFGVSQRRACRCVHQHRSSQRYCRIRVPDEAALREQLHVLARRHPRYGYRRIHVLLVRDAWRANRKRIQRLWRDEGLRVPTRTRRRQQGRRAPGNVVAGHPDHVWAMDFEFDQTREGRPIKILNITDEFTRECLASLPARSINADRVYRSSKNSSSGAQPPAASAATMAPNSSPKA